MIYSDNEIKIFLENHGISLKDYGSSELGIHRNDAIIFLELLLKLKKNILGIEVWRWKGNKFNIDSLGGWYSVGTSREKNFFSAREFILNIDILDNDLMTIQFGEP